MENRRFRRRNPEREKRRIKNLERGSRALFAGWLSAPLSPESQQLYDVAISANVEVSYLKVPPGAGRRKKLHKAVARLVRKT